MSYKIAIVGATGNVGRELLEILSEREFPADEVFAIAFPDLNKKHSAPKTKVGMAK